MLFKENLLICRYISLFLVLVLVACQPGPLVKKEPVPVAVDSVLFFEQKEIADPFLDSLNLPVDREVKLISQLLPPTAPAPPDYNEIDGFRIQLFAGLDTLNARTILLQARNQLEDEVYLLKENGLYKVQVGDYPYRVDADNKNLELQRKGFSGTWVVSRPIRVARSDSARVVDLLPKNEMTLQQDIKAEIFHIQILATSDEARARQVSATLNTLFNYPAWYEKKDTFFKVYLGKFSTREPAEAALEEVRKNGYPDAWLVY